MATKARLRDLGRTIADDFAFVRDNYSCVTLSGSIQDLG